MIVLHSKIPSSGSCNKGEDKEEDSEENKEDESCSKKELPPKSDTKKQNKKADDEEGDDEEDSPLFAQDGFSSVVPVLPLGDYTFKKGEYISCELEAVDISSMTVTSAVATVSMYTLDRKETVDFTKQELLSGVDSFFETVILSEEQDFAASNSLLFGDESVSISCASKEIDVECKIASCEDDKAVLHVMMDSLQSESECDWEEIWQLIVVADAEMGDGTIMEVVIPFKLELFAKRIVLSCDEADILYGDTIKCYNGWMSDTQTNIGMFKFCKTENTRTTLYLRYIFSKIFNYYVPARQDLCKFLASHIEDTAGYEKVYLLKLPMYAEDAEIIKLELMNGEGEVAMSFVDNRGKASFDFSNISSSTGKVILKATVAEQESFFIIEAGSAETEYIVSVADNRLVYPTKNRAFVSSDIDLAKAKSSMYWFHTFVDSLQSGLVRIQEAKARSHVVAMVFTRGMSAGLLTNMMDFIAYLLYENIKLQISDSERTFFLDSIKQVIDAYARSMAKAQFGLKKDIRKRVARDWLFTIRRDAFKRNQQQAYVEYMPLIMCGAVSYCAFTKRPQMVIGAPMFGSTIDLEDTSVAALDIEDAVMTDSISSMFQKYINFFIPSTDLVRLNTLRHLKTSILYGASQNNWSGHLVVIKKDGLHSEPYSSENKAYGINAKPGMTVETPGKIGKIWKELTDQCVRVRTFESYYPVHGKKAMEAIETMPEGAFPMNWSTQQIVVLDMDENKLIVDGEVIYENIIFSRPNEHILIAERKV